MNSNKDTETQIHVFSPNEILKKREEKKFGKKGIIERLAEKLSASGKASDSTHLFCKESSYKRSVKKLWNEFRRRIISGAVTATVAIIICVVVNLLNWKLGYEVYVDGENIGYVTDKQTVYGAIDSVRDDLREHLGEDSTYEKEPVFVRRIVSGNEVASREEIENALMANVDAMVYGYAVYVDGEAVFGVSSPEAAEWVFAQHKKNSVGEITDDMSVDFCEKTEVKPEYMSIGMFETPTDALAILSGENKELKTHTVKKSDTIWNIAEKYGTSIERILAMNEGMSTNISEGMVIKVEEAVPILSVRCVQTVSLTEVVPFKVEKIDDSSIYEGRTVIAQKGQDGTAMVLATVTKVNGVETKKEIISSEPLTMPVDQIEKVGTKVRPATTGSGTFANPTQGILSSRYGLRWNRSHNGIDIAGAYNSNILAADGGVVTYADWMDGYGNYVVIDHENGYQTAYGHCASLDVSVGDRVTKGEVIAKMGNTGRSTGTHLHFEVKKDGVFVNPLEFVGY